MPPPFTKHIFVCMNEREPGHPKGCCAEKNSPELLAFMKAELRERGLDLKIRANKAGCLDSCEYGPTVVIYPEAVWYWMGTQDDVLEIIEKHQEHDEIVTRLLIPGLNPSLESDTIQPVNVLPGMND